jgi:hypothetical protein
MWRTNLLIILSYFCLHIGKKPKKNKNKNLAIYIFSWFLAIETQKNHFIFKFSYLWNFDSRKKGWYGGHPLYILEPLSSRREERSHTYYSLRVKGGIWDLTPRRVLGVRSVLPLLRSRHKNPHPSTPHDLPMCLGSWYHSLHALQLVSPSLGDILKMWARTLLPPCPTSVS